MTDPTQNTQDVRLLLTTPDDVAFALAQVQQQLADYQRYQKDGNVDLTAFRPALFEATRVFGNETQKETLNGQRKYSDEITNGLSLILGMGLLLTGLNIPHEQNTLRSFVLITSCIFATLSVILPLHAEWARNQNKNDIEKFSSRTENLELVEQAYAIMEAETGFKSLVARKNRLNAQYKALSSKGKLPDDLEVIVSDIASAAANKDVEEFQAVFKPHGQLLDNSRFRNRLIIVAAEHGGLEFLFEQVPQARLPVKQAGLGSSIQTNLGLHG